MYIPTELPLPLALKVLTVVTEVAVVWFLVDVWRDGRHLAAVRAAGTNATLALERHRYSIAGATVAAIGAVVLIETQIRMNGGAAPYSALALFHLSMVGLMVVLFFAIVFRYTGLRHPQVHRVLVYLFLLSWAAIILSGTPMLFML